MIAYSTRDHGVSDSAIGIEKFHHGDAWWSKEVWGRRLDRGMCAKSPGNGACVWWSHALVDVRVPAWTPSKVPCMVMVSTLGAYMVVSWGTRVERGSHGGVCAVVSDSQSRVRSVSR